MLTGKNVRLRAVKKSDLENFVRWFNDPEVTQYLVLHRPVTELEEERWIERLATDQSKVDFVIEVLDGEQWISIGTCAFNHINHKDRNGDMGMAIGEKEYHGKGYGTEALRLLIEYGFNTLNLHRVAAGAHAFNERSLKMQRRAGLVEEGRKRQAVFVNGQYHDSVINGLLRSEWEKLR